MKRANKFNARKVVIDGIIFDSKAEGSRYSELKILERAGEISKLSLQPVLKNTINGVYVGRFTGDFYYFDIDAYEWVFEDVKSEITRKGEAYRLRKRVTEACHGMTIIEVRK